MTLATITAAADAFLYIQNPTTHYGTNTYFAIGEDNTGSNYKFRSLLQFTGLDDGVTVPGNAAINAATLVITTSADRSSNARDHAIYRIKRADTNITQCTWNVYKTGSSWSTAGAFGLDDCEQTEIGYVNMANNVANNTAVNITLDAASIQEIVSGVWDSNILLGMADTETDDCYYYHSVEGTTPSYRPYMIVNYSLPAGAPQVIII